MSPRRSSSPPSPVCPGARPRRFDFLHAGMPTSRLQGGAAIAQEQTDDSTAPSTPDPRPAVAPRGGSPPPGRFLPQRVRRSALVLALGLASLVAPPPSLFAQEGRQFQISGGWAFSYASDGRPRNGRGHGAAVSLEYILNWTRWVDGRLYGGVVFSGPDRGSCGSGVEPCSVSSQIGMAGAKGRLLIPIPWVAPFLEMGAGVSAGSIETRLGGRGFRQPLNEDRSGFFVHRQGSLGLAFGRNHQHDVSLDAWLHRPWHIAATLALGIGF